MADFKSKPGSFLPLLEYSQKKESVAPPSTGSPLTLLEILARQTQHTLPLFDLQALGNMEPTRYGAALKALRDAGFIEIVGDAPDQMVHLTDNGAQVARVAQSV